MRLIISDDILAEVRHVLRDSFHAGPDTIETLEEVIHNEAIFVAPIQAIMDCRDAGDNKVLEAATAGKAHYIVTFDDDLWKMSPYRGIQILTVRNFLRKTGLGPRRRKRPVSRHSE